MNRRSSRDAIGWLVLLLAGCCPTAQVPPARHATVATERPPVQGTVVTPDWDRRGVSKAVFSPDGSLIATVGSELRIWDAASGELRAVLGAATGAVAWSANGRVLATGRGQGIVVWDAADGTEIAASSWTTGTLSWLGFSPDGALLVWGDDRGRLSVWDTRGNRILRTVELTGDARERRAIDDAAFHPGSALLAVVTRGGVLRLVDVARGEVVRTVAASDRGEHSVAFLADGGLVTGGNDGKLRFVDVDTGTVQREVEAYRGVVNGIETGRQVLVTTGDSELRVWETDGRLRAVTALRGTLRDVSRDGTRALMVARNVLQLVDLSTGQVSMEARSRVQSASAGTFVPGGGSTLIGTMAGDVAVVDLTRGTVTREVETDGIPVVAIAASPDGRRFAIGHDDGVLRIYDAASLAETHGEHVLGCTLDDDSDECLDYGVTALAFSPDSATLAVGGTSGAVHLLDSANGRRRSTIQVTDCIDYGDDEYDDEYDEETCDYYDVSTVSFSPDGTSVAVGAEDGLVTLWDVATRRNTQHLSTAGDMDVESGIGAVAFSPDGSTIAVAALDAGLWLWDLRSGQHRVLGDRHGVVVGVSFNPSGETLAAVRQDGTIELWNPSTGERRRSVEGLPANIAADLSWGAGASRVLAVDDVAVGLVSLTDGGRVGLSLLADDDGVHALVRDDEGRVDGDPAALAMVRVREPGDLRTAPLAPLSQAPALRRSGLLRAVLGAESPDADEGP